MLLLSLLCMPLMGCGGGGEGEYASPEVQLPGYRIPFVESTGSLGILDPTAAIGAANPAVIETGLMPNHMASESGVVLKADVAGGGLADLRPVRLLYTNGGRLLSVNLEQEGPVTPIQVSNLSDACEVREVYQDYSAPQNARVLVGRRTEGGSCRSGEESLVVVRVGASPGETPASITSRSMNRGRISPLHSPSGALLGFLHYEGPMLVRRDADFGRPRDIVALPDVNDVFSVPAGDFSSRQYFVAQPDQLGPYRLYRYQVDTEVVQQIDTMEGWGSYLFTGITDATHFYYVKQAVLYRVAHDSGSPVRMTSTAYTDFVSDSSLVQTNGRIVFQALDSETRSSLRSLPKGSISAMPSLVAQRANSTAAACHAESSGWLTVCIYDFRDQRLPTRAIRIRDDGSGAVDLGNAYVAAPLSAGTFDPRDPRSTALYLMADYDAEGTHSFNVVEAASGRTLKRLGAIRNVRAVDPLASVAGYGRYISIMPYIIRGPSRVDADAYFADTTRDGGLRPVYDTAGADDYTLLR